MQVQATGKAHLISCGEINERATGVHAGCRADAGKGKKKKNHIELQAAPATPAAPSSTLPTPPQARRGKYNPSRAYPRDFEI